MHFFKPLLIFALLWQYSFAQESFDLAAVQRIKNEALTKSKVMNHAFYLTDVSGPRLSNSPGLKRSQEWAVKTLQSWNLQNVALEPWGDFGRGWEVEKYYAAMTTPYYSAITGSPKAWTPGTNGPLKSEVLILKIDSVADFEKYKGKLANKIVLLDRTASLQTSFKPNAVRYTDEELTALENFRPRPAQPRPRSPSTPEARAASVLRRALPDFLVQEKVGLVLSMTSGSYGTFYNRGGESHAENAKPVAPELEMSSEDFLRILRLVKNGIKVEIEAEIKTRFITDDIKGYNVVAEIPGEDKNLKDEVVILGGHLDSWHLSTGATDNAAGCAVMMEAIRIIKLLDLKPKRTIRMILWSSEEQGLFGSKAYVKNHYGDYRKMTLTSEHDKVSAYYNLDYGSGKIRGVYLQNNPAVRPIFTEWLRPFHELGATTLTIRGIGQTDHMSFDAIGIPGFQFIQDPLDYFNKTHHTNQDTFDRLQEDDLKQASAIVAAFVYNTSQRAEKLPRKKLLK